MRSVSTQNIFFFDDATKVMGTAYDRACKSILDFSVDDRMRVLFAERNYRSRTIWRARSIPTPLVGAQRHFD